MLEASVLGVAMVLRFERDALARVNFFKASSK